MTTPNTTISIQDLITEFHPINNTTSSARSTSVPSSMSEFKGEGPFVRDFGTGLNTSVPTGNPVTMSSLRGKVGTRTVGYGATNNAIDALSPFTAAEKSNHITRTVINDTVNAGVQVNGSATNPHIIDVPVGGTLNGLAYTGPASDDVDGAQGNPAITANVPTIVAAGDAPRIVGGGGQGGGRGTANPGNPGTGTSPQTAPGAPSGHWNSQTSFTNPHFFGSNVSGSPNTVNGNPGNPGNPATQGNQGTPGGPGQSGTAGNPGTQGNKGNGGHTPATTGGPGTPATTNAANALGGWNSFYGSYMLGNNAHQRVNNGDRNNRLRMINGTHSLIQIGPGHHTNVFTNNGNQYSVRRMSVYTSQGQTNGNISSNNPKHDLSKGGGGSGTSLSAINGASGNDGTHNPGRPGGAAGPSHTGNVSVDNNR